MKYAAKNKIEDPFTLSAIYYLIGDYKNAHVWEQKTVDQRSPSAYLLNVSKLYDPKYFNSPEHQEVLKRMGFVK